MKHVNANMIAPVLAGIALGESLVRTPDELVLADTFAAAERLRDDLATRVTGRFLPARQLAFAEGVIGAYSAASYARG